MNRNINKKLIIMAVIFSYIIFSTTNIFGDTSNEAVTETLAVTLVIDTSGSMETTDPQKLREIAANIFIDLLSSKDYLGIITFNTKEEVVFPIQQVKSSDNKAEFKKMILQKIGAKGDTDYLGALNEASKQLSTVNEKNVRKVVLFLTDGEPEPNYIKKNDSIFMNQYMDSLWKTVENLAEKKYEVYSIGFSSGVDSAVLERISSTTKGTKKIFNDSTELAQGFFDILGVLKNRNEFLNKSFQLNGNKSLEVDLDENTSQATMVFINNNGQPFELMVDPPDVRFANDIIAVNKSDKYSIVTITEKDKKLTGKWKINLKGNGNITTFGNVDKNLSKKVYDSTYGLTHDSIVETNFEESNGKHVVIFIQGFVVLTLLIIILDLLLYRIIAYKNLIIKGCLLYWEESDIEMNNKKEVNLSSFKKNKIVVSFNEKNENAQYHISNNEYEYDIELKSAVEKNRWKFMYGYKALFYRSSSSELMLKTSEPGIFTYEGRIFTSSRIYKGDRFTTGGYVFQYIVSNHKLEHNTRGKNLLKER